MKYKCIKEWTLTTRHIPEGAIVHVTSNDNSFMINVEYQGHTRQMNWSTFRTHFEEVKK